MINIHNLSFSYNKKDYTLENINLNIPKGSYVSIVGSNGSGKTTLMKILLKQLKPSTGRIEINSKKIGYVPQRLDSFNSQFSISVKEILSCHGSALKLHIKNYSKILKKFNLEGKLNSLIGNLSGGQCQKVLIARALMGNPQLLFLDEMSTGVDEQSQLEIYDTISNLNKTDDITILSVEHDISKAFRYSTHILEVSDKKALLYTVNEYKNLYIERNSHLRKVD